MPWSCAGVVSVSGAEIGRAELPAIGEARGGVQAAAIAVREEVVAVHDLGAAHVQFSVISPHCLQ